jgi:hypothetical protein
MISAQTLRVCREGKLVPTPHQVRGRFFPDHALEAKLGNAAPVDAVPVVMRPVDRERLPRGIAAIMARRAPVATRLGFFGCRCRLGGLWRDRGARNACGRLGLRRRLGGGRRRGRFRCRVFGVTGNGSAEKQYCRKGKSKRTRSHVGHPNICEVNFDDERSANRRLARIRTLENPPATAAGGSSQDHFEAVLVSMLTTWTRRLAGSIGAFASFGLVLP